MPSDGRLAVVTGGARGIGFAVAESLASAGFSTVILDNGTSLDGRGGDPGPVESAAAELVAKGYQAQGRLCDVSDWQSVSSLAKQVGPVDVVANVAGILRPGPFLDDTEETWRAVVSTHIGGHLNLIQAFLPSMVERGSGHIVNFTSTAALLGSRRQPAYSTAKESIVGLTRYLGRRLAGTGVRVNAVSPGAETRMSTGLRKMAEPEGGAPPDVFTEKAPAYVGRFVRSLVCEPEETTGSVFLVTGRYVTRYEHIGLWKWVATEDALDDEGVAERIEMVLRRPHPTVIGPWPTRDFRYLQIERNWEGTSIGPDLLAAGAASAIDPMEGRAIIGNPDERSGCFAAAPGEPPADRIEAAEILRADRARRSALAVLPGAGARSTDGGRVAGTVSDTDEVCAGLVEVLRYLQSAIRATGPHRSSAVAMVLPGPTPWLDPEATLADWMLWYGAVGAVRGGAATEAIYGVRVNGLVVARGEEAHASSVVNFALAEDRDWFNGYILTTDPEGVGLLGDERPAWQCFSGDGAAPLPKRFVAVAAGG